MRFFSRLAVLLASISAIPIGAAGATIELIATQGIARLREFASSLRGPSSGGQGADRDGRHVAEWSERRSPGDASGARLHYSCEPPASSQDHGLHGARQPRSIQGNRHAELRSEGSRVPRRASRDHGQVPGHDDESQPDGHSAAEGLAELADADFLLHAYLLLASRRSLGVPAALVSRVAGRRRCHSRGAPSRSRTAFRAPTEKRFRRHSSSRSISMATGPSTTSPTRPTTKTMSACCATRSRPCGNCR